MNINNTLLFFLNSPPNSNDFSFGGVSRPFGAVGMPSRCVDDSMDTMSVGTRPSLSATNAVPLSGPTPMSIVRPQSSVGCAPVVRPSMSDTANAVSYAVGPSQMQFDNLPMQFASQLHTSSPNVTDMRFSGMQMAHRPPPPPGMHAMYPPGYMYSVMPSAPPASTVPQGTSSKPVPVSIPYFVASRPQQHQQFVVPPPPAPMLYRPNDGYYVDRSKPPTIGPEPPSRP